MSVKTEYSRLLLKRTSQTGATPTINTGSTVIDNTWISTDIMPGELFLNSVDDRMWVRTNNGIIEIALSGISGTDNYTTGATLTGQEVFFDTITSLSAYSVDLSSIADPGLFSAGTGGFSIVSTNSTNDASGGFSYAIGYQGQALDSGAGTYAGLNLVASGVSSVAIGGNSNTAGRLNAFIGGGLDNVIDAGNNGAIVGGDTNTNKGTNAFIGGGEDNFLNGTRGVILGGFSNLLNGATNAVILGGKAITATTNDTTYMHNLNVDGDSIGIAYDLSFAASDETTAISSGVSVTTLYSPRDFSVSKVKASLTTSGSTTTTVDVNIGGVSILTSPIDLASGVYVNSTTGIITSTFSEDDKITVDIDAAGTAATGLKIYLIGKTL